MVLYFKKIRKSLPAVVGCFIIAMSWNWYHNSRSILSDFLFNIALYFILICAGYYLFKKIYAVVAIRLRLHKFWSVHLLAKIDEAFFCASLLFIIFFFKVEYASLIYGFAVFYLLYWWLNRFFSAHPQSVDWQLAVKKSFLLFAFVYISSAIGQYWSFKYYILDSNTKFFNITFFRSLAITMFWMMFFSFGFISIFYLRGVKKYLLAIFTAVLFVFWFILWVGNMGILYFSGLYISPVAMAHAQGSLALFLNSFVIILIISGLLFLATFTIILRGIVKSFSVKRKNAYCFIAVVLIVASLVSMTFLRSFRNLPEVMIIQNFYEHYFGSNESIQLDDSIKEKLKMFGINHNYDDFYLNYREKLFDGNKKLLPDEFSATKPNIIIIFLESFSARLTDVYNQNYKGVTPGLVKMANDKNTTIFKKYYNASTPTVTGLLSQLCSFLPPTGHNEIEKEHRLQRHYLYCLPQALSDYGNYTQSTYITAVNKNFANKDTIFASMGVDKVWGTDELAKVITGEPLSWGYSDHQMMPAMWEMVQKQEQPFLMMLSTVDSHPPYTKAKDMVNYNDGKQIVLNSIHTTDHAFEQLWDEFSKSQFYRNTIFIAVADHAIFPAALTVETAPEAVGKIAYYDENTFLMYIPDTVLPKEVDQYSSGIDFTPTILHILGINAPNSFEGHSIFDDYNKYDNILGMHELGLYINQSISGQRKTSYDLPSNLRCNSSASDVKSKELTLCEYYEYYQWKRQMFEQGRFWMKLLER
ncbi:MAG: LTA synthase family protein [bacterium]